jgi:hypothetical protein
LYIARRKSSESNEARDQLPERIPVNFSAKPESILVH